MKKRILSILLALCMCLTFVPVTVLAEDLPQQDNSIRAFSISPDPDNTTYCTYEFYVNGEKVDTQIVKNGDTLLEPQVEAQDGKVFTGWDQEVPFGKISGLTGEDRTFRVNAVFADGYYVYFKDNNGRIIATKTGKSGDMITFEDVSFAVDTGEAITGWYTDKDCTSGNQVEFVTIENSNITLYAKVEKGYWLTFESNGGSYVAPAFYANGTTAKSPDEPTKSGYTFAGWYTDGGLTTEADFSTIKANTTVYAKWTAANETNYTVIHWQENVDDDKFSFKESETKTGTTGELTTAAAKSYDGFTGQKIEQKNIAGDGSTIVNVYYTRNVYTINFWPTNGSTTLTCGKEKHTHNWRCYDWWGNLTCTKEEHTHDSSCYGAIALCTITAKYGANISDQWPARSNGSTNWSTTKGGGGPYQAGIDVMPLGGGNFYVPDSESSSSASASYYVEVLEGESGTKVVSGRKYKLHHTDTVMMWNPSITWNEDFYNITGFTRNETDSAQNGGRYNGAKFYYYRNSYEIKFINGGNVENTVSKQYEADISDVSYTPTTAPTGKEGYTFAGWYDNELCEGTPYVFTRKTMPAQNITLYAKWVAPTYTVTVYDVDGRTVLETFAKVPMNSTIDEANMPVGKVTKDSDDEFLGWVLKSDENSLDGMPFNFSTKITKDYELRAKVGSKAQYSVTYNANATGATGSVTDTEKYAKGAEATVKSNSFTNDGKVFLSWNTQANGTGTTYYPNSTVKITGDVTLYAQWGDKASTVTVTYHSNFGTDQEYTTKAMPNNEQITVADYSALGLPTHTGYSFAGWNTEADGTGTAFAAGASARVDNISSNDLYAQWTPNTDTKYTVEFYYQNADGSYALNHTDNRKGTTDTTVYVTEEDKAAKEDGKYVYDTAVANVESGAVVADGTLVLKLYFKLNQFQLTIKYVYEDNTAAWPDYSQTLTVDASYSVASPEINGYTADQTTVSDTMPANNVEVTVTYSKRTDLSYTVNYYWNDKTTLLDSETVTGQTFNASVTKTPITISGYTPVSNDSKTITIGTDTNVINFYYYKNVELTANSDTKVYTGAAQTITGYTASISGLTFNGISASGTGTDVGEYSVTFGTNPKNMVDTTYKYIVTEATDGKLEIKQRDVTITGESASKTYNGKVQEITGITVEGLVDGHRLTGLTYSAKGKDAGKYDGSFTGRTVITDTDGKVVTDNYNVKTVAGVLTITRSYRPSTPSTPSTPVTSVKTGDMGIALYAMTSLLSLSGAVAIIKKRKEDEK